MDVETARELDGEMAGYEGVEAPENFPDARSLEAYRQLVYDKTVPQVAFIQRHRPHGAKLRVLEFCSGNGRLLIALARADLLEYGLGIEIAESRIRFARQWTEDLRLDNVRHVAGDVLGDDGFEPGTFDLVVCITGAFQYFRPIREDAPERLLAKMRRALADGGKLLLELYPMPEKRRQMLALNNGSLRLWQPLPPADRFLYYLSDFRYSQRDKILRHEKTFIGKDGTIDSGRVEVAAYYSQAEIEGALGRSGFRNAQVWGDFEDGPYAEGTSELLIAMAESARG